MQSQSISALVPFGNPAATSTMTSREIAELTGKKHSHVCRDIRTMLEAIYDDLDQSCTGVQGVTVDRDYRDYIALYRLSKDLTLTLVTGYDAVARLKVFSRIEQLNLKELLAGFDVIDLPPDRFVYVAMERESKRYKVGISKHPEKRVSDLSRNHPEGLVLMAVYAAQEDGFLSEMKAHQYLSKWRLNGEWFAADAPVEMLGGVI